VKTINHAISEVDYFEKMVLSRALMYPETRQSLRLEAKHFKDDRHGAIYGKLVNDIGFNTEKLLTVSIQKKHQYGDYDFVRTITEFPVASKHGIVNDQIQVYEFYKERKIKKLMTEYLNSPTNEQAMDISNEITRLNQYDLIGNDSKVNMLAEIRENLFVKQDNVLHKTGFDRLDEIIDGFEMQQMNVIAARPSMGKTAFALQMAVRLQKANTEVVFCSIESSEKNMTQRLLSNISKVELRKFKDPVERMSTEDIENVLTAMNLYHKMNLRIEEKARFTPNMVRNIANNIPDDKNGFIIIDYLQLMQSEHQHNGEHELLSYISREMKIITQEFPNITIIPLLQLNRATEQRQNKRPVMSDLRGSGQTEQDASMIMMLYRDDYYHPPEDPEPGAPSLLEVIVSKNKDGGLGTAELEFHKSIQKIY